MKERFKLQEDVTNAALKELDHTITINASKSEISPLKNLATDERPKDR